jgi:glycosyltransferase involved in cell wall biosynthesis
MPVWYNRTMDLSIVVPSFKQAPTIQRDLRELTVFLESLHKQFEIILVIDGDIDSTKQRVAGDPNLQHIHVIALEQNRGKGFALKTGFSSATGALVGFIDAGGDIEYSCLNLMINFMQFSNADIVIGSKRHPLSQVSYPLIRHMYSFGYQLINRLLFRMNIRDTQVGAKLFRKEALETILPKIKINKFAFDLELLVQAQIHGYTKIIESPVRITHRFQSTISTFVVLETLQDTISLFFRTRNKIRRVLPSPAMSIAFTPTLIPKKQKKYAQKELAR